MTTALVQWCVCYVATMDIYIFTSICFRFGCLSMCVCLPGIYHKHLVSIANHHLKCCSRLTDAHVAGARGEEERGVHGELAHARGARRQRHARHAPRARLLRRRRRVQRLAPHAHAATNVGLTSLIGYQLIFHY